ncbi:SDR family oxidoreductase [Fulvivirgaceae bacterium BMA10]|uniref:SDR family oxidoreductase n=1 Tax=Splendidivirga corallicola TaxID=3051826 RepID=A0ABT8KXI1_9BACT|nr:SDR family oxidoreductase [Fulvivirgaceae bacterium BMA10]
MTTQKKVVVTGSSNGIGYLTVLTLARQGHKVFATMRGSEGKNAHKKIEFLEIADSENLAIEVVELDVTDDHSVNKAVDQIIKSTDNIDVLINNAGVMFVGITEAYSLEQVQQQFDTNFFGVLRVSKAFLPHMREHRSGFIINVSSLAGRLAFPYFGIYGASKWALEAYSESLKYELAPLGIDVAIVEPGPFPSGLLYSGPEEADNHILGNYGDTAQTPKAILSNFDNMYNGPGAPVTQDVADAISHLIHTRVSERPFRTVAGLDFGTIELNNSTEPIQKGLIKDVLQMDHLLEVKL